MQWQQGDSGGMNLLFVDCLCNGYDDGSADDGVLKLIVFLYYVHWFILFHTCLPL